VPLASRIQQFIDQKAINVQAIHHARSGNLTHAIALANALPEQVIKTIALVDREGPALLVLPFLVNVDLAKLNSHAKRNFQRLNGEQTNLVFSDCDQGHLPGLATAYGLPVFVDEAVLNLEYCFAASGCASTLLKMSSVSVRCAMETAIKGDFSHCSDETQVYGREGLKAYSGAVSIESVTERLQKIYRLPPMPETAIRILHMTQDPNASLDDLATLIERDPSLAAQILRYARSALFNFRGELTSVKDAVNIVLGFERVSKLALGIAATKAFDVPNNGPLGLAAFWQHALYTAVLSQALATLSAPDVGLDHEDAYLAGLLHNFGLLLTGHLFPPEFRMLNKLREAEPDAPMCAIEKQVFGMGSAQEFISLGHGSMGAILLKLWGMPEVCIKTAAMHQKTDYQGEHQCYVQLIQLSNALLAQYQIGDECVDTNIAVLCENLGFTEDHAQQLAASVVEQCQSMSSSTASMVA